MSTTTWGAGAYPLMAERLGAAAVAAVDRAEVQPGERVVDIATGTGNAALLAAALGAEVVGVDFETTLLSIASRRARSPAARHRTRASCWRRGYRAASCPRWARR